MYVCYHVIVLDRVSVFDLRGVINYLRKLIVPKSFVNIRQEEVFHYV